MLLESSLTTPPACTCMRCDVSRYVSQISHYHRLKSLSCSFNDSVLQGNVWMSRTSKRRAGTANSIKGWDSDGQRWIYPLIGKGVSLCLACSVAGYRFPADSSFKNSFVMVVLSPLMYPRIPVGGLLLDWSLGHVCILNLFLSQSLSADSFQDYQKWISRDHYLKSKTRC